MSDRATLRTQLLVGAASSAFLIFSAPAVAQDATPETPVETTGAEVADSEAVLDTVTVSGIRG